MAVFDVPFPSVFNAILPTHKQSPPHCALLPLTANQALAMLRDGNHGGGAGLSCALWSLALQPDLDVCRLVTPLDLERIGFIATYNQPPAFPWYAAVRARHAGTIDSVDASLMTAADVVGHALLLRCELGPSSSAVPRCTPVPCPPCTRPCPSVTTSTCPSPPSCPTCSLPPSLTPTPTRSISRSELARVSCPSQSLFGVNIG